jgi:hypothetical protein
MSAYTDADVQRAVDAIDKHCEWSKDWASDTALCIATDILPVVAPAIAARAKAEALREESERMFVHCTARSFSGVREWFRDRADEIERATP